MNGTLSFDTASVSGVSLSKIGTLTFKLTSPVATRSSTTRGFSGSGVSTQTLKVDNVTVTAKYRTTQGSKTTVSAKTYGFSSTLNPTGVHFSGTGSGTITLNLFPQFGNTSTVSTINLRDD